MDVAIVCYFYHPVACFTYLIYQPGYRNYHLQIDESSFIPSQSRFNARPRVVKHHAKHCLELGEKGKGLSREVNVPSSASSQGRLNEMRKPRLICDTKTISATANVYLQEGTGTGSQLAPMACIFVENAILSLLTSHRRTHMPEKAGRRDNRNTCTEG